LLATIARTHLTGRPVLVRADSAFYGHATVSAALKAGAYISVTARSSAARTCTAHFWHVVTIYIRSPVGHI
jgi:hypothetical protein